MSTTDSFKGYYAGFVSRLLAYAVDIIIIVVSLIFAGWLVNTVSNLFTLGIIDSIAIEHKILVTTIATMIFSATYFILFWTLVGRTPGKFLMGLRVISRNGRPITFWQALRRYLGYYLSALALYAGFLWVLIDNRRQGWHDKLANTFVVYDWEARPGSYLANRIKEQQDKDVPSN